MCAVSLQGALPILVNLLQSPSARDAAVSILIPLVGDHPQRINAVVAAGLSMT